MSNPSETYRNEFDDGKPLEKQIIKSFQELAEKLGSGQPIEVTEIKREETPDGPMHTRTKKIL